MNLIIPALVLISSLAYVSDVSAAKKEIKKLVLTDDGRVIRTNSYTDTLLIRFKKTYTNKELSIFKKDILLMAGKAVPTLIKVMKSEEYPIKNRWVATFLLGRIAGAKSSAFISKFADHPNWIMRMAALKTLLAIKETKYVGTYSRALSDPSLIVRKQALENVRLLQLTKLAPTVWKMMYDKKNYHNSKKGMKRTRIISDVIKTVGDLQYKKAKKHLVRLMKDRKYNDLFTEVDYSLKKITGIRSPKGNLEVKRKFWNIYAKKKNLI